MRRITRAIALIASGAMLLSILLAASVMAHAGKGGGGWTHACIRDGVYVKAVEDASKEVSQGVDAHSLRSQGHR